MARPPKLDWHHMHADPYMVQSEIVCGEPRQHYAVRKTTPGWSGLSRSTARAAQIDAEYHAVGRFDERPAAMALTFGR